MGEYFDAWTRKGYTQSPSHVHFIVFGIFLDSTMQLSFCINITQIIESVFSLATQISRKEQIVESDRSWFHTYSWCCYILFCVAHDFQ